VLRSLSPVLLRSQRRRTAHSTLDGAKHVRARSTNHPGGLWLNGIGRLEPEAVRRPEATATVVPGVPENEYQYHASARQQFTAVLDECATNAGALMRGQDGQRREKRTVRWLFGLRETGCRKEDVTNDPALFDRNHRKHGLSCRIAQEIRDEQRLVFAGEGQSVHWQHVFGLATSCLADEHRFRFARVGLRVAQPRPGVDYTTARFRRQLARPGAGSS